MNNLDRSHDSARHSWVAAANGDPDFPIQNLPFGRIRTDRGAEVVVAIGDQVLPIAAAMDAGWGRSLDAAAQAIRHSLNAFAAAPPATWTALRLALSDALADPDARSLLEPLLRPIDACTLLLPFDVGDYSDFYASIFHATNVGSMFRPDNPLLPNYKWVPIGYHGRASSVVVSGKDVRRPSGQLNPPGSDAPTFAPSGSLDYELELGIYVGGRSELGEALHADCAADRIFGMSLLNDWSARDIQAWEYQPLGPFLAKNFITTVSPWVVTRDALRPFAVAMPARPEGDPAPLPYLQVPGDATVRVELDVLLRTASMRNASAPPSPVSQVNFADAMYWSPAQLLTHHGSNGCNLQPGDLLGTGTISGPEASQRGCLLERTWRGAEPLTLSSGEVRKFLEDGDEVIMRGHCHAPGAVSIGFGECRGTVVPA